MLGQLIGAGVGMLGGALNAYNQNKREQQRIRIEEDHTRKARADLDRAAEANANLNPAAMAQRSRQDINATLSGAQGAAANAAAGQAATSGDFGNSQGAAATMSQATSAAAAPYAQQLAGVNQAQYEGQANKVRQAQSIADSTGQLSNQINYIMQEKNNMNPLGAMLIQGLSGALGGANTGEAFTKIITNQEYNNGMTENVGTAESPMYAPRKPEVQRMLNMNPEPPAVDMNFQDTSMFDQQAPEQPAARSIPYNPQPLATRPQPRAGGFLPLNMANSLTQPYMPIANFLSRLGPKRNF